MFILKCFHIFFCQRLVICVVFSAVTDFFKPFKLLFFLIIAFLNDFSAAFGERCPFLCESRGGLTLRAAVVEKAVYL